MKVNSETNSGMVNKQLYTVLQELALRDCQKTLLVIYRFNCLLRLITSRWRGKKNKKTYDVTRVDFSLLFRNSTLFSFEFLKEQ